MSEDHDMLIEIRADMKHVRERVDHLASSDGKQWEKLDAQGRMLEGHDKTIAFLNWGFRGAIASMGAFVWAWFKGDK